MEKREYLIKFGYYSLVCVVIGFVLSLFGKCLTFRGGECMIYDPILNGVFFGFLLTVKEALSTATQKPIKK